MKIAFCSCSKQQNYSPQPVWQRIEQELPDVVLLLGDNIYLDTDSHDNPSSLRTELRSLYSRQNSEPGFAALRSNLAARGAPLLAIYDDHDFLGNNRRGGDHDPRLRETTRQELIRALSPPQTGADVYSALTIGDVKIIVLDTRFYRQSPRSSRSDRNAFLGQQQWDWFEREFRDESRFIVVASSTPFHKFGVNESWKPHREAYKRLRQLVEGRPGALVVSGDIHKNKQDDDDGVIEFVSSAVSRRGKTENYAVLTFDQRGVDADFKSQDASQRSQLRIELADWSL